MKPNYSYKPKSWVSGYKIQEGNNSDGYPTGGIPVQGFKVGGRVGLKEGTDKNSERYKKMMKEKAKIREGREVRDVKGKVISREGRPHSTYAGRVAERRRGYLRKNKMLPGQVNEKKRIQIKERDPYKKIREQRKFSEAGFKPLRASKQLGGRIGLKKGSNKNWIQKAVNPKHKGFCTPMTKKTCTPKRKALARTFKKMGRARKGKA